MALFPFGRLSLWNTKLGHWGRAFGKCSFSLGRGDLAWLHSTSCDCANLHLTFIQKRSRSASRVCGGLWIPKKYMNLPFFLVMFNRFFPHEILQCFLILHTQYPHHLLHLSISRPWPKLQKILPFWSWYKCVCCDFFFFSCKMPLKNVTTCKFWGSGLHTKSWGSCETSYK